MVRKAIWILSLLVLVTFSVHVALRNSETISVYFGPSLQISANKGVVMLVVYFLGILSTCLVWAYFGIKSFFREMKLEWRDRKRQTLYESLIQARSFLAVGDWQKAQQMWERMIKKDSTDVISRVELSRCLEDAGKLREALKVVDAARAIDPKNLEVLFRAAELNLQLNNKTAAIDNLALILCHYPCRRAAENARDLSDEIGRAQDALEYHEKLEDLIGPSEKNREIKASLELKKILKEQTDEQSADPAALKSLLRDFVKKYPDHAPALEKLAEICIDEAKIQDAAQLLVKAAKASGAAFYWYQAARLWVENSMIEKGLAVARMATANTSGIARLNAELYLIRFYISLSMLDEAKLAIDGFYALANELQIEITQEINQNLLALKGYCLNKMGQDKEAAEVWRKLSMIDFEASAEVELKKQKEKATPLRSLAKRFGPAKLVQS